MDGGRREGQYVSFILSNRILKNASRSGAKRVTTMWIRFDIFKMETASNFVTRLKRGFSSFVLQNLRFTNRDQINSKSISMVRRYIKMELCQFDCTRDKRMIFWSSFRMMCDEMKINADVNTLCACSFRSMCRAAIKRYPTFRIMPQNVVLLSKTRVINARRIFIVAAVVVFVLVSTR